MNSIKKHLALIIPLLALLFSLESILSINRVVGEYQKQLTSSYSIVIASKVKLELATIKDTVKEAKKLELISTDSMLGDLKDEISKENMTLLKKELPYFYNLNLNQYPSSSALAKINDKLSNLKGVINVESFAKSHSQTYSVLLILKSSIALFGSLIVLLSYLLMTKHIEVWRFEHLNRMEIMGFLGASSVMKNKPLFKLAIADSIISAILVFMVMYYFSNSSLATNMLSAINISGYSVFGAADFGMLFGVSIIVSVISVFMVIIKQKGN